MAIPRTTSPTQRSILRDLCDALEDLPEALGFDGFAGVDLERARRSVHVYIEGRDFHLDVVPCIAPDGFAEPIYVPDYGFDKWVQHHPIGVIELLNAANINHDGEVKNLGRLLKHFRNQHMKTRLPKSYWLLALLLQEVEADSIDTSLALGELFRDLVDAIYGRYAGLLGRDDGATPNIPDPMLRHNVSWKWKRSHFETFMRRLDDGRNWATKALAADNKDNAIEYWQRVLAPTTFRRKWRRPQPAWVRPFSQVRSR